MKRLRPFVVILVIAVVALAAAWALNGANAPTGTPGMPSSAGITSAATDAPSGPEMPAPRSTTDASPADPIAIDLLDPDAFASAVAAVVFSLDARGLEAEDYRRVLMLQADPLMTESGVEDLRRMVTERVPDEAQWARMRANEQWSQWSPTAVWEPQTWAEVVTDGLAEPGWVMRNVTGTQTTHYVDAGEPRTAVSEPTVTIGMRCPAPGADVTRCHLTMIGTVVVP